MSLTIKSGTHFYRFTNLTPANFGAAFGHAHVDSPTQVDSQFGLPYIPDTALKGVLRSCLSEKKNGSERDNFFGTPDLDLEKTSPESIRFGRPGQLAFGNAEIVMFPLRFSGGQKVHAVVLHNVLSLIRQTPSHVLSKKAGNVLRNFLTSGHDLACLEGNIDTFDEMEFSLFKDTMEGEGLAEILSWIKTFMGDEMLGGVPIVACAFETAEKLWKKAAETRTLTQMEKQGTASEKSLRTIELIPAGSVFICSISNMDRNDFTIDLTGALQLGAWENIGAGWFRIESLKDPTDSTSHRQGRRFGSLSHLDSVGIMREVHDAVSKIDPKRVEAGNIKAAISKFGFRLKAYGVEAALAFELARAKPLVKKHGPEMYAHRWLLSILLGLPTPAPSKKTQENLLADPEGDVWFQTPMNEEQISKIEFRWRWLRKYAELGID